MPTSRPRHMITETDDIRRAIDDAASEWPELAGNRADLVRHLILAGAPSAVEAATRRRVERLHALAEVAGSQTGMFPPDAARGLSEEWPA